MIILKQLVPLNLDEEKQKFFSLAGQYDPQFKYESDYSIDELSEYGLPQTTIVNLAERIVAEGMAGQSEEELTAGKGKLLSQSQVTKKIAQFLAKHELQDRVGVIWSSSFIARTSITPTTIKLKLPCTFREESLLGMLYHEIGTHALRRVNYEQQPWFKKKKKYGFAPYLRTEEGLAILHSLLPTHNKFAYSSALRYLAVAQAQRGSFRALYQFLNHYITNPDKCWRASLRRKLGLADTSLPGGYTKDLVYFEGMVEVWRYLAQHDFNPETLYFGKMSYQDAERARDLNPDFRPRLPSFYTQDRMVYQEQLRTIGRVNFLD